PSITVVTSTTAGSTRFEIACWVSSLVDCPFEEPAGGAVLSGASVPVEDVPPLRVRTHPMPMPPLTRTSAATTAASQARPRLGGWPPADAGRPCPQGVGCVGVGSAHQ